MASSGPVHKGYLDDYYIDKHEITNMEYRAFVESTGHRRAQSWTMDLFRRFYQPVDAVSWRDVGAFCAWSGKRLPTEAEWEKAACGLKGSGCRRGSNLAGRSVPIQSGHERLRGVSDLCYIYRFWTVL